MCLLHPLLHVCLSHSVRMSLLVSSGDGLSLHHSPQLRRHGVAADSDGGSGSFPQPVIVSAQLNFKVAFLLNGQVFPALKQPEQYESEAPP